MRTMRLTERARLLGECGVEHSEALNVLRHEREEAEQRWQRELDEIEQRLIGPHERCAICQCAIRLGERVVRLPCIHVYHEECIMPKLQNGTVTQCPFCRMTMEPAVISELPVYAWGE